MSEAAALASIAALHLVAMASPGPNVLLVAQTAMARSRPCALAAAAGVASGAALLATAAVLGLSVVFRQVAWLHLVLQLAGAVYLVILGAQIWRSARQPLPAPEGASAGEGLWRWFRRGLLTNLTNPKAAVFYGSILATALAPELPAWARIAAVALIAVNALWWHSAIAVLFARPRARRLYGRGKRVVDRVVGAALAAFGIQLALTR